MRRILKIILVQCLKINEVSETSMQEFLLIIT